MTLSFTIPGGAIPGSQIIDTRAPSCYFCSIMLQKQRAPRHACHVVLLMIVAGGVTTSEAAATDELRFEVASVKPAQSTSGRFTMNGGPGTSDPGRISYTNIMLRRILLSAYDVRNYQISGPD